eukprot:4223013-Amphidinium_carterae.1
MFFHVQCTHEQGSSLQAPLTLSMALCTNLWATGSVSSATPSSTVVPACPCCITRTSRPQRCLGVMVCFCVAQSLVSSGVNALLALPYMCIGDRYQSNPYEEERNTKELT